MDMRLPMCEGKRMTNTQPLSFCPADDLARGACRTLGYCWGHECVGFADCPCSRCCHKRYGVTTAHPNHDPRDASYCGACRTASINAHRISA